MCSTCGCKDAESFDAENDKWCDTCGSFDLNPDLERGFCDSCICVGCNEQAEFGEGSDYCKSCYEETFPDRRIEEIYEMYAESFEPTITDYKLIKNQEIDGEQMKITVDYQGMPYSGILDGGYWGAESFDADWSNAPYGSWDEAWSDQVTFTQRKGYFRPRNLALAGIAYWVAMKLRK